MEERRGEARRPANRRALVIGPGAAIEGRITDESKGGVRLRLDQRLDAPGRMILVEMDDGSAVDLDIVWVKGREAGGRLEGTPVKLSGLVPQRLAAARDASRRAGGR